MTTAHKPTYHPAIGRVHAGGYRIDAKRAQFSSRDLASHMTLKVRQDLKVQDQAALKSALLESERKHRQTLREERMRQGFIEDDEEEQTTMKIEAASPPALLGAGGEGDGDGDEEDGATAGGAAAGEVDLSKFDDEDDAPVGGGGGGGGGGDSESDSDDDSDDDAELARELDLIRREREAAKIKAIEAEAAAAEAAALASIHSNPLLPQPSSAPFAAAAASESAGTGGVKRRWDDDVVSGTKLHDTRGRGKCEDRHPVHAHR